MPGARNSGGRGGKGPDPLNGARDDARHHGVEPDKRACRTDPVDVASGQMLLQQTDLDLPGVLPLALKRTHLSDYTFGVWFGRSWASTLDERIEVDIRNQAMWAREDGTVLVYGQLPGPQTPEVMPLEGLRIPLRRISEMGAQDLEFAATDPRTGWTRYFSKPGGKGWQLWLTTIEDRNGNQIDIHRDATGRPLDITHSGGYDINVTGAHSRVTALTLRGQGDGEPALPVVDFGYDEDGNLTEVINSSGIPLRFTYDMQGRITSWTDRNNSTYRYAYDTAGRVVLTVGPDGFQSSTFVYDAEHRTTRWTNAVGAVTEFRLSERGQIIAETDPLGHTTVQRFTGRDQLLARIDPLGRTTGFEWNEYGNLVMVEHADGQRTHVTYNHLHQSARASTATTSPTPTTPWVSSLRPPAPTAPSPSSATPRAASSPSPSTSARSPSSATRWAAAPSAPRPPVPSASTATTLPATAARSPPSVRPPRPHTMPRHGRSPGTSAPTSLSAPLTTSSAALPRSPCMAVVESCGSAPTATAPTGTSRRSMTPATDGCAWTSTLSAGSPPLPRRPGARPTPTTRRATRTPPSG